MSTATKETLFKYVDRDLYDMQGFVDYRKLRNRLGIKAVKLAQAAGKTQRSMQKNPYSENIQDKLRKIVYILVLLKEMLRSEEEIAIWLRAPNPDYDGLSPMEIITAGKMDSIIRYLEDAQKGALT
ncbi:MAG: DUF2384 domain-containing protein [Candidatus Aminicenantes bacterium]|nr:DUF2384 domain-containing protein [Candidatus Aminicenantes bacterium]